VNGARDTVLQLQVHLGDGVLREDGGIGDVTDSSRLNHVADGESLDSLILGSASRAVAASDGLDVAAALLVSAAGKLVSTRFKVRKSQCRSIVVEHHIATRARKHRRRRYCDVIVDSWLARQMRRGSRTCSFSS
jgi:hypothetical protein